MTLLQSVLADLPFSILTIRNDKTGAIIQDGFRPFAYGRAKDILKAGVSYLLQRRMS
jgi:hypothetical protein